MAGFRIYYHVENLYYHHLLQTILIEPNLKTFGLIWLQNFYLKKFIKPYIIFGNLLSTHEEFIHNIYKSKKILLLFFNDIISRERMCIFLIKWQINFVHPCIWSKFILIFLVYTLLTTYYYYIITKQQYCQSIIKTQY